MKSIKADLGFRILEGLMSVNGISNTGSVYGQLLSGSVGNVNSPSDFKNTLKNELLMQISNRGQATGTQYSYLSGLTSDSPNKNNMLMAALIRQGSLSGSGMSNVGTMLSGLTQGNASGLLSTIPYGSTLLSRMNGLGNVNPNEGVIPYEAWKPVTPAITSNVFNRNPQLYRNVIKQFSVETNGRYAVNKNGHDDTYCNIFVWDVTKAMGAEIPHYYNPETGAPMQYPNVEGGLQMSANRMHNWLFEHGEDYGWYQVTPEQAQAMANQGRPAMTVLKNDSGHGHVQMVCPSNDLSYDEKRGVTIAQAGRKLTSYQPITQSYRASLPKVVYFAHM